MKLQSWLDASYFSHYVVWISVSDSALPRTDSPSKFERIGTDAITFMSDHSLLNWPPIVCIRISLKCSEIHSYDTCLHNARNMTHLIKIEVSLKPIEVFFAVMGMGTDLAGMWGDGVRFWKWGWGRSCVRGAIMGADVRPHVSDSMGTRFYTPCLSVVPNCCSLQGANVCLFAA
jgi:hypothetical protein